MHIQHFMDPSTCLEKEGINLNINIFFLNTLNPPPTISTGHCLISSETLRMEPVKQSQHNGKVVLLYHVLQLVLHQTLWQGQIIH